MKKIYLKYDYFMNDYFKEHLTMPKQIFLHLLFLF